jgi:hypothetical protein
MNKKEIYFMMFCIKNGKNPNEPLHIILIGKGNYILNIGLLYDLAP